MGVGIVFGGKRTELLHQGREMMVIKDSDLPERGEGVVKTKVFRKLTLGGSRLKLKLHFKAKSGHVLRANGMNGVGGNQAKLTVAERNGVFLLRKAKQNAPLIDVMCLPGVMQMRRLIYLFMLQGRASAGTDV